jgi:hypothetical protein
VVLLGCNPRLGLLLVVGGFTAGWPFGLVGESHCGGHLYGGHRWLVYVGDETGCLLGRLFFENADRTCQLVGSFAKKTAVGNAY